jgi:hypothetical protein
MKTKTLPQALNSRRVKEAFTSLTNYVKAAREIARDVGSVKSSEPKLTATEDPEPPNVTYVDPEFVYYGKTPTPPITVEGDNLEHVRELLLVLRNGLDAFSASGVLTYHAPKGSTKGYLMATFDLKRAPVGNYNVQVADEFEQSESFTDLFSIKPADVPKGELSCDIEAVVPNEAVISFWDKTHAPQKIFVQIIGREAGFPSDVQFSFPKEVAGLTCELAIFTPGPRTLILPITVSEDIRNSEKSLHSPIKITAAAPSLKGRVGECEFNFILLQSSHLSAPKKQ